MNLILNICSNCFNTYVKCLQIPFLVNYYENHYLDEIVINVPTDFYKELIIGINFPDDEVIKIIKWGNAFNIPVYRIDPIKNKQTRQKEYILWKFSVFLCK